MGNKRRSTEIWGLTILGSDGMAIPAGTTAQRTAAPQGKEIRVNTSLNRLEHYDNGMWNPGALGLKLGAEKTSNFNASLNTMYSVRRGSGFLTITFPSAAAVGDKIAIYDPAGTWVGGLGTVAIEPRALVEQGVSAEQLALDNQYVVYEWTAGKWRKTTGVLFEFIISQLALKETKIFNADSRYRADSNSYSLAANVTKTVHTFANVAKVSQAIVVISTAAGVQAASASITCIVVGATVSMTVCDAIETAGINVSYDAKRETNGKVSITVNSNLVAKADSRTVYSIGA